MILGVFYIFHTHTYWSILVGRFTKLLQLEVSFWGHSMKYNFKLTFQRVFLIFVNSYIGPFLGGGFKKTVSVFKGDTHIILNMK